MAIDTTAISWAGGTWNVLTGCSVCSPGCANCYAMKLAGTRLQNHPSRKGLTVPSKSGPVWTGEVRFNRQWLDQPLRRRTPTVIFVCAHSDLFHPAVPDEIIDQIFEVMARCPHHLFMVLTKRAARARSYIGEAVQRHSPAATGSTPARIWERIGQAAALLQALAGQGAVWGGAHPWPLRNVWLGTSVEDQTRADERLPELVATPAALRFVSAEPLLERVDLSRWLFDPVRVEDMPGYALNDAPGAAYVKPSGKIGLVIAGGESQRGARWLPAETVRGLHEQCEAASTVFHFKQWGAWLPADQVTNSAQREAMAKATWQTRDEALGPRSNAVAFNVGPAIAGHLLDGIEYRGMPPWPAVTP